MSEAAVQKTYVVIETGKGSPSIRGFDLFLCPWQDAASIIHDYLDSIEENESASLTFTIRNWSDEELEKYCEANDVEMQ